jgi:hypothetical protein
MNGLGERFATFEHSAWRLEARDVFDVPGEAAHIDEYLRTGLVTPSTEWGDTIRAATARGASMGRVRLVGFPVTGYTRFELAAYAGNTAAGEDVRLVDRRLLDASWADAPDFWMFDGREVWLMNYDAAGAFLGADLVDDPTPYQQLRDAIVASAVPLADFHIDDNIPAPRRPVKMPARMPIG